MSREAESYSEIAPLATPSADRDEMTSAGQPVVPAPRHETKTVVPAPRDETKTVVLPEGKTLRLLALDLWGSREFWIYIYLANKDKISNPNRVPSGIELTLPDKFAYSINAADPHSVDKAKSLGNEILKGF